MGKRSVALNGAKIKKLREKAGKTQKELIRDQLTLRTYQRAEQGLPVSTGVGRQIAGIFKTPLEEIVSSNANAESPSKALRFQPCNGKGGMNILKDIRCGRYELDFDFEIDPSAEDAKLIAEVIRVCERASAKDGLLENAELIQAVGQLNAKLTELHEHGVYVHFAKEYFWRAEMKGSPHYVEPDFSVWVPSIELRFSFIFSEESAIISRPQSSWYEKTQVYRRCHRLNYKAGLSIEQIRMVLASYQQEFADQYEEYLQTATFRVSSERRGGRGTSILDRKIKAENSTRLRPNKRAEPLCRSEPE